MMRLVFGAALLGLAALAGAVADEVRAPATPELTVRITPQRPYVQEAIVQTVRLVASHPFAALTLDLPPIEGAEVITLQPPTNRRFETFGGQGFIYETSRAIFPKQSGELRLAPVAISGSLAAARDRRAAFSVKSDATILDIRPPPASFRGASWLIARQVEIVEHWSKPVDRLRQGDRVTRTVEVTAFGVTSAHLPDLEQDVASGLTVLPGRTDRRTDLTASDLIGRMSHSFELRIDGNQPIEIAPVGLVWWNTDAEAERRSVVPALRLEPLPRDVEGLVATLMAEAEASHQAGRYAFIAATGLVLAGAAVLAAWLMAATGRPTPADGALREAVRRVRNPTAAVRAFLSWGKASFPGERPMSFEHLGRHLGIDAARHLETLEVAAFSRSGWPADAVDVSDQVIAAARARRRQRAQSLKTAVLTRLLGPEQHLPEIAQAGAARQEGR